jgi:hypothetical protein
MRAAVLVLAVCLTCIVPSSSEAWGLEAHRFIMDRAIDRLPPELLPFFDRVRPYMVERSIDPDLWRIAGWEEEPPRHFVDLDAYGAYPFNDLPREYDRAVEKFGVAMIRQNGVLPWRVAEMYGNLRRAFQDAARGESDYAVSNARFYAAILAHYVSDAHVPFHAVLNHDGQLTGQRGIHARFETELFERYRNELKIAPPEKRSAVSDARAFAFDALLASYRLAQPVLDADRRAAAGREAYDGGYFERFFADVRGTLEQRLSDSIAGVAAVITGAWDAAGRPRLPLDTRRRARPVPKSNR